MTFLGMPRSTEAAQAPEAKPSSVIPLVLLAALCLLLGILPTFVIPFLSDELQPLVSVNVTDQLVPSFFAFNPAHQALPPAFAKEFHDLGAQVGDTFLPGRGLVVLHRGGKENPVVFAMSTSYMLVALVTLLVLTCVVIRLWLTHGRRLRRAERWDGGVRHLLPEMTYTATGFSNPVRVVFEALFRPTLVGDTRATVAEHFRTAIRRRRIEVNVVDRFFTRPAHEGAMRLARNLAIMHHGRLNAYSGYVLLALLAALIVGLLAQS